MLHLFEDYIYTNHSQNPRNTRYGPVTGYGLQQATTTARVRTPVGKDFTEIVVLIFLIPRRLYSHLTAGNSETIYTDHSQNLRIRDGTVVKHGYQAATTRVRHLIFKDVCAKPTPHFLIPAAFPMHSRPSEGNTFLDSVDTNGKPVPLYWRNFKTAFRLGLRVDWSSYASSDHSVEENCRLFEV